METLKYKIIKTEKQYYQYCNLLETLVDQPTQQEQEEEIELLTLLIEKWDDEHTNFQDNDPVEILKYLMAENQVKPKDLADSLNVSKSVISEILNYKKGFSKEIIRKLADRFKLRQEAFNRPYKFKTLSKNSFVEESAA